ncbi:hypothetical protein D7V64_17155 [Acinetobacter cumulans]|uniref:Uncharacterized protein n=1 Tax=Acinetobacter cumulans TaxID=2136182 RepID=A0A3A8FVS2_9GAMM|nr:hypothetical protein D7V64_17155 [Acinetobacter cumulans]
MQGFITYKLELWPDLIIQAQDIRNILSQDKYSKSGHFNFGLTLKWVLTMEIRITAIMLNGFNQVFYFFQKF